MSERGVSESTEWALLVPVLMLVVLGIIQAGIWLHGRTVVGSAASAVAEQVAWGRGSDPDAAAMGSRIAGSGGLRNVEVRIDRGAGSVRVTVSAQPALLVDLGLGVITEHSSMPLETVRP